MYSHILSYDEKTMIQVMIYNFFFLLKLSRRSPSPDCEIVTKKPSSAAAAIAKQKTVAGPKIPSNRRKNFMLFSKSFFLFIVMCPMYYLNV